MQVGIFSVWRWSCMELFLQWRRFWQLVSPRKELFLFEAAVVDAVLCFKIKRVERLKQLPRKWFHPAVITPWLVILYRGLLASYMGIIVSHYNSPTSTMECHNSQCLWCCVVCGWSIWWSAIATAPPNCSSWAWSLLGASARALANNPRLYNTSMQFKSNMSQE